MEKKILAVNLDGFLIRHKAFSEPHKLWFDRVIELTGDKSFEKWKGKEDYFKGVSLAMNKILPSSSEKERITQAREWYQEDTVKTIKAHPTSVDLEVLSILIKFKIKFTLALITTNTSEYIKKILEVAGLGDLFDIILASDISEEPNKAELMAKFVKQHGKPNLYIAGRDKKAFEECKKLGITSVYFTQEEEDKEIKKISDETITSYLDLDVFLSEF